MLVLQAFVALDAACGVIASLALFVQDLDAIDAALGIDQLKVVGITVGPWHAVGRKGAGAVGQAREKLHLGLGSSLGGWLGCWLGWRRLSHSHRRHSGKRQGGEKS